MVAERREEWGASAPDPGGLNRGGAPGRGPQSSREGGWTPGPGKDTRGVPEGPASEGLQAAWQEVSGAPDGPLHLLVPPPAQLSHSLPLQSSMFLEAQFICCLLQEAPRDCHGLQALSPPQHLLLLERISPLCPPQYLNAVGGTDQCPLLSLYLASSLVLQPSRL